MPGLNVIVTDLDSPPNSQFSLSLEPVGENGAENIFVVEPPEAVGTTPVTVRVLDPSQLDYESDIHDFLFDIVADGKQFFLS